MAARMSSAERRKLLAEAMRDIIMSEGEKAATVRVIATKANMPLASFHCVCESREEAVRDVGELLRADDSHFDVPSPVPGSSMEEVITNMVVAGSRWQTQHS